MSCTLTCQASQIARAISLYVSDIFQDMTLVARGATIALVVYLVLVRVLRFRRYRAVHKKYQRKFEEKTLTPEEAQKIMLVSSGYDMPLLLNYSLAFALFKTYAVPSISKILAATRELANSDTVSRRYADTEILIATWVGCPISGFKTEDKSGEADPRANIALARTNYLHSRFKISNDDYLYTLILFAVEPSTWARRYGWRELSPMEEYAFCVFWIEIGKRMSIQDIPETPEAMRRWARAYEEEHMVPSDINKEVAGYTIDELLYPVPKFLGLRDWAEGLAVCMLDEPVRVGMMQPPQPWYNHLIVWSVLKSSAFFQKWFMLPRSNSNYRFPIKLELTKNKDGSVNPRMHPNKYQVRPWYKPESTTAIGRALDRLAVWANWHSHIPNPSLHSNGYRLEEMGPIRLETTANQQVLEAAAKLQGCPITDAFTHR